MQVPKPSARVVLIQSAVTACILLSGHDLHCIVPIKHLMLCPESWWWEFVLSLGNNGGLTEKWA